MQKLEDVQIHMSGVNYLIGNEDILNMPEVPFSDEVCKFLNDLSKEILGS